MKNKIIKSLYFFSIGLVIIAIFVFIAFLNAKLLSEIFDTDPKTAFALTLYILIMVSLYFLPDKKIKKINPNETE